MHCDICKEWPTWAVLCDCDEAKCPWKLDLALPIPPLPKSLRDAPVQAVIVPPPRIKSPKPVTPHLQAGITQAIAPVHSYASMVGAHPQPASATVKPVGLPVTFAVEPKLLDLNSLPSAPNHLNGTVAGDFDSIMQAVRRMNWSGQSGPTVWVGTPLKWSDRSCRNLYLAVKQVLHDQPIRVGLQSVLYLYVGKIGNWGKSGFRISGHSKNEAALLAGKNVDTHGVLHVDK